VLGAATDPAQAAAAPRAKFRLFGSQLRIVGPRSRRSVGDSITVRGVLHRAAGGPAIGAVFKIGTVLGTHETSDPLASVESHLLQLDDGTLTGTGTVTEQGIGTFTITGGSGRYAGARGTYATRQSADHSGGGTAEYTFVLR
jgi:hypothetical protein